MVDLPWRELDPRTHPFDRSIARTVIDIAIAARKLTYQPRPFDLGEPIHEALVEEFGGWVEGWRWTSADGGPVRGAITSYHRATIDPQSATNQLLDWRDYLELLDRTYAQLRIETSELDPAREVERAANRILALVAERTQCEDAWYRTFARAIGWYLESSGIGDAEAQHRLEEVASGSFGSWAMPDEPAALAASRTLGAAATAMPSPRPRDALAEWLVVRAAPIELEPRDRELATRDAHVAYIETFDRARDPDRADRLAAALLLVRDSAQRGQALSFDQLAEWQRVILETTAPVPFRTTDAFAKDGRERYAVVEPELFERALAEAADGALPVAIRAARVYLDVCFFHPFPDGNARAARLALDHVISSAGLVLETATPVFTLSRSADDPHGVWGLALVIERSLRQK